MRIRPSLACICALAAALLAAGPACAQSVRGRIVEPGTGQPVAGAVVMLLDPQGARVTATLSDTAGAYTLIAGAPGTYTVRAERVGYAGAASSALALAAGATAEQTLELQPRQLVLEPLVVQGSRRNCTIRPQNGPEAAIVWEELRKALDAAAVAEDRRRYGFRRRIYQRRRTLLQRRIVDEEDWTDPVFTTEPFHATPVERLARYGYAETTQGDSILFHAPDARTLLTDAFLDQHCFRLRERRGSVGLEFAPTADRRLPDVRGVLWMDGRTGRLRRLEYTYVNLPFENPDDVLGGELEFEQLPDGAWIVRRWSMRMPRLAANTSGDVWVTSLIEKGGEVIGIQARP